MSAPFHFKQFSIAQDRAPMKVGTDGVLLGAWVPVDRVEQALDIGTGTGLIALMLAQRCAGAQIVAVERNADACRDAAANIDASPWSNRVKLVNDDIQHFHPDSLFDLIVSNPPFFKESLKSFHSGRTEARHDMGFSSTTLADTTRWLKPDGRMAGIYPLDVFEIFYDNMQRLGFNLICKTLVHPTPNKAPHRVLFTFSRNTSGAPKVDSLVIEEGGRHQYSEAYTRLTSDFYLDKTYSGSSLP